MTKEGEPPMRGQPEMTRPSGIPGRTMESLSNRELEEKIGKLERENSEAGGWGAAVGAREEWIKELRGELGRRIRKEFPQLVAEKSNPGYKHLFDKHHISDEEIMDMIANLAGGNIPAMQRIRNRMIEVLEGELRRRNPKG